MISRKTLFSLSISLFLPHLAALADEPYEKLIPRLRLEKTDLEIPSGWPLDYTVPAVEELFKSPLKTETTSRAFLDKVEASTGSAALLKIAYSYLEPVKPLTPVETNALSISWSEKIPGDWRGPISAIAGAAAHAQKSLGVAINSISAEQRVGYLSLMEWTTSPDDVVLQEISSRRTQKKFDGMKNFDLPGVLTAAHTIMSSADRNIPRLMNLRGQGWAGKVTLKSSAGKILLGGAGDDVYTEEDLEDVLVLVDVGGRNTYVGPVAAAGPGEVRVAIDLGTEVAIEDARANAGSGIFGIGLMYLPNSQGVKKLVSGSFSQGCGIGGVGGLFVNGEAVFKAGRYVQGAGSFGVGIIDNNKGKNSQYEADRSAQGAGFTKGIGIFRHRGDGAQVKGGLVQPDPREPLGTVSLCQGVGFGRRAYSGGGIGVATLTGNNIMVQGSYFAQGCGYWHALGAFSIRGDNNIVQARRYDQGSGIHSAFGYFRALGDDNRILNWGVGPSYGWDRGVGSARIEGDRNEVQVEWGAAAASIGSISFSAIRGHHNKLRIPDFANGSFTRDEVGFSFHVIEGTGNIRQMPLALETSTMSLTLMTNPWGIYHSSGVQFVAELQLAPPVWSALPQERARRLEMADLRGQLQQAPSKAPTEKAADLLDIAAAFSLDKDTPRMALSELLRTPIADLPSVIDALEPAAVEQLIQLRIVLAAFGKDGAQAIAQALGKYEPRKKAILLSQLSFTPPTASFAKLEEYASMAPKDDNDQRLRLGALRILGAQMNRDTGAEPGLRAALDAISSYLSFPDAKRKETITLLQRLRLQDGFAVFSTAIPLSNDQRVQFVEKGPKDITETLGPTAAEFMLLEIEKSPDLAKKNILAETEQLDAQEKPLRERLAPFLQRNKWQEVSAAVAVLGQIGNAADVEKIMPLLNHVHAQVREASAVALGRMGAMGLKTIEMNYLKMSVRERCYAMTAIAHATDPAFYRLFLRGIKDPDEQVRLTALSVLNNLPPILDSKRPELIKQGRQALLKEKSTSIQTAGFLLK